MTNGFGPAPDPARVNSLPPNEQPDWQEAVDRSAIDPQHIVTQQHGWDSLGETLLMAAAGASDGMRPWGTVPTLRDRQLRAFLTQEPFTFSAISTVIARNIGLSWKLDGPSKLVEITQDMFHRAQFGQGWETWGAKTGYDYQGQDKGAVTELVRDEDNPNAPVIMFNQLDAGRCWNTGNPQVPVLYQDRLGRWHGMKWYQCLTISEMPVSHETLYGLQYCSATRVLTISQILRNILRIDEERSGGRWSRALHILSGIKKEAIEDALKEKQEQADALGLLRYILPSILTTTDPNVDPKLVTLSLMNRPDDFKLDEYLKWYLTAIAMGLFVDYGELAPLPGNQLGTSAQSVQMHKKSRSKGVAIWTNKLEHQFNFFGVVPRSVTFQYDDNDVDEDAARADVFLAYAQGFQALMGQGAIDAEGALRMLIDVGLIPQDIAGEILDRLLKAEAERKSQAAVTAAALAQRPPVTNSSGQPSQAPDNQSMPAARTPSASSQNDNERANQRGTMTGQREMTVELGNVDRVVDETGLTEDAKRALAAMGNVMRHRLAA